MLYKYFAMEALLLIALIVIIFLLISIKSFQKEIASRTHESFLSLKKELIEIKEAAKDLPVKEVPVKATDKDVVQWRPYTPPEIVKPIVEISPVELTPETEKEIVVAAPVLIEEEQIAATAPPHVYPETDESWWQKWLRNNPDLEKFIGENLINSCVHGWSDFETFERDVRKWA